MQRRILGALGCELKCWELLPQSTTEESWYMLKMIQRSVFETVTIGIAFKISSTMNLNWLNSAEDLVVRNVFQSTIDNKLTVPLPLIILGVARRQTYRREQRS